MKLLEKKTLHEEIADTLRDLIIKGELQEGDKINENELCAAMGISKTPLREALRVLSVEGLVQLVPNRGSYVAKPTFEEIKEMFDVMSALEGLCARTAAEKMSDKDLSHLEKLHNKLEEKYESRDLKGYLRYNDIYHSFLQDLAGNTTLNQMIKGLRKKILLYRLQSLALPERLDHSIKEHRELIKIFRKRDSERAEGLMRKHLKAQCDAIEKLRETILIKSTFHRSTSIVP
ncbi:MAG: GntR family transcriptional regulator [Deltaproteobacteria bacterium]|nr:GntR family transcriptional regulator [Deltaproteobacteria bacterium]